MKLKPCRNLKQNFTLNKCCSSRQLAKMAGAWPKEEFQIYNTKANKLFQNTNGFCDAFVSEGIDFLNNIIKKLFCTKSINDSNLLVENIESISSKQLKYIRQNYYRQKDFLRLFSSQTQIILPFINKLYTSSDTKHTLTCSDNPFNHKRNCIAGIIGKTGQYQQREKNYKYFLHSNLSKLLNQKNNILKIFNKFLLKTNYSFDFKLSKAEISFLKQLALKFDTITSILKINGVRTQEIDKLFFSNIEHSTNKELINGDIILKHSKVYDKQEKKDIPVILTFANTEQGYRFKLYKNNANLSSNITKLRKQYKHYLKTENINGINALNDKIKNLIKDSEIGEVFVDVNSHREMQNKLKESGYFSEQKIQKLLQDEKSFYYVHNLRNLNPQKYYNVSLILIRTLKEFGKQNNVRTAYLEALAYGKIKHSPVALYLHAGCKPISEKIEDIEKDLYNHKGYDYTKNVWLEYKI